MRHKNGCGKIKSRNPDGCLFPALPSSPARRGEPALTERAAGLGLVAWHLLPSGVVKFLFGSCEHMFDDCEHVFGGSEYVFATCEQRFQRAILGNESVSSRLST